MPQRQCAIGFSGTGDVRTWLVLCKLNVHLAAAAPAICPDLGLIRVGHRQAQLHGVRPNGEKPKPVVGAARRICVQSVAGRTTMEPPGIELEAGESAPVLVLSLRQHHPLILKLQFLGLVEAAAAIDIAVTQ